MEDVQFGLGGWAEDLCEVCGEHVGYGIPEFHLGRCDEHSNVEDDKEPLDFHSDSNEPSTQIPQRKPTIRY